MIFSSFNSRNLSRTAAKSVKRVVVGLILSATLLGPVIALADDKDEGVDARLEGYLERAAMPEASNNAMTWIFFSVLSMVALGGLFMRSNRTHLD